MQAMVCEAFGGPEVLALREMPDPPPPGPGEVQVRITRPRRAICRRVDAGREIPVPARTRPSFPGSEGAGEIVAVGPDVSAGSNSATRSCAASGSAPLPNWAMSKPIDCDPGAGGHGPRPGSGFSQRLSHRLSRAVAARPAQSRRLGAHPWCCRRHRSAGDPDRQTLRRQVIATASTDEKRAVCLEEGADHAIPYQDGFRDKVLELTQGRGVDIIYDPVNGPTFEESLRCLAWSGRILILGFLGGPPAAGAHQLPADQGDRSDRRADRRPQRNPSGNCRRQYQDADRARRRGQAQTADLAPLSLAQAADAVQALIDRAVIGKAVLVG